MTELILIYLFAGTGPMLAVGKASWDDDNIENFGVFSEKAPLWFVAGSAWLFWLPIALFLLFEKL